MPTPPPLAPIPNGLQIAVPVGTSTADALRDAGYDPASLDTSPASIAPASTEISALVGELAGMVGQAKSLVMDAHGRVKTGVRVQDMRSVMASATALMNTLVKAEKAIDANARIALLENAFVHAIGGLEEPHRSHAMQAFEGYVTTHEIGT